VQLLASGGPDLNPCDEGRPCPTQLRIYELKSGANLEDLDFLTVHDQKEQAFGDAFVKVTERVVFPGRRDRWTLELDPSTTHVVSVGLFHEPLGDAWYQVFAVPQTHHEQACDAAARGAPIGDPCIYLAFDGYEIDGGRFPPAGFELRTFETTCAPVAIKKVKQKQRKRRSLSTNPSMSTINQTPPTRTTPTAPTLTKPSAPTITKPSAHPRTP